MAGWRWGLDGWPKVTIPAVVGGVLLVSIGIATALFGYEVELRLHDTHNSFFSRFCRILVCVSAASDPKSSS